MKLKKRVQKIADVTGLDLNLLDKDQSLIINAKSSDDNQNISDDDRELLALYHGLDAEDRAEIRGEIKGMLKAAKYKSKVKSDEAI